MEGVEQRKREQLLDEESLALLKDQERQEQELEATVEERLTRHVHPSKGFLFAAILLTLFLALVTSVTTESTMAYAILGLLPTVLALIVFLVLLEGDYKDVLFWIVPLAFGLLFFALAPLVDVQHQLDVPVLTAVNMVLAYLFLGIMLLIEYRKVPEATLEELEHFEPKELGRYLHTIEEKCKAINFAIGRVYRASNGGTASMREKLKVPSEWYNGFHAVEGEAAQKDVAKATLQKIEERLSTLLRLEKEVFTADEIKGLKNLARDDAGKDRLLDVLVVNDNDPVEEYFLGAMDFCKRITKELEKK